MHRVAVIVGSVRPGRIGLALAQALIARWQDTPAWALELVDLRQWTLPMDDEPGLPAHGVYEHAHTRVWSAKIDGCAGCVFVTPQYNWGYPAALKNALDHLYAEWRGKPAVIVSYGHHGGGKAAAQLRQVLDGLRMQVAATMPGLLLAPAADTDAGVAALLDAQPRELDAAWAELRVLLARRGPA